MALGIVYYMRLDSQYRKKYEEYLDKQYRLANEVNFSQVRQGANDLISYSALSTLLTYMPSHLPLPAGI